MAGHSSEDPFSRATGGTERGDPFASMREQMEKERENFFRGSEWQNEPNPTRPGLFNRPPRTSFAGFPSSSGSLGPGGRVPRYVNDGPEDWDGFGQMPGAANSCGQSQYPGYSTNSLGRQKKNSEGRDSQGSDQGSNCSGNSGHSQTKEGSVPINVHHTTTIPQPKHRYGQQVQGGRNTTELPARATSGDQSPRLERAHSEPPNKFNQRLNLAKPHYTTIPENSESYGQANRPSATHLDPGRNPIKTSASDPSVPSSSQSPTGNRNQESQPVPPPRRSPPRPNMQNQGAQPTNSAANVRHIPIFVEGRPEPIFNTNTNAAAAGGQPEPQQDMSFPKPSDYYPPGVQRLKSHDGTLTPETPQFKSDGPFAGQKSVVVPVQEPTTPQGPPPGPIPMGYMPSQSSLHPAEQPAEPTTPQGPPPGPIPMGYVPSDQESTEAPTSPVSAPPGPIPLPCGPHIRAEEEAEQQNNELQPPQNHKEHIDEKAKIGVDTPDIKKKNSIEDDLSMESLNIKSCNEKVPKAEPLVNVIPIKVDHAHAETPNSKGSSRAPSQEPQNKPGKSPTPQPEPQINKDPKIAKLDKIQADVEILQEKIENFRGTKKDKDYLYLDEMLTRHLIALDGVEPEGQQEIRQLRKESIKSVNRCLSLLDHKVTEATAEDNNQILSDLAAQSEQAESKEPRQS